MNLKINLKSCFFNWLNFFFTILLKIKEEFQFTNRNINNHKEIFDDLAGSLELFKLERSNMKKNIEDLTFKINNKLDYN